ncbi:hypothetical protein [Azospirillum argentinense]
MTAPSGGTVAQGGPVPRNFSRVSACRFEKPLGNFSKANPQYLSSKLELFSDHVRTRAFAGALTKIKERHHHLDMSR